MSRTRGPGTECVWAGEAHPGTEGSTVPPVHLGVTFAYDEMARWKAVALGEEPGHIYSRNTNPTVARLEEKIRLLEGAEAATAFATGMAAISNTLSALLDAGDRVVSITDTYGGTHRILHEFLPRRGIEVTLIPTHETDALEAAIAEGCRVVYLESPTNPTLKVLDLERLAGRARDVGAVTVVDNTFATPLNQRPLELGADLVVHSATKFLGGHSDAMGGLVAGSRSLVRSIFEYREIDGASLDPMSAFLIVRGMQTLELRVDRQNRNAERVARRLADHPAVRAVHHPSRPDHPAHEVARRQMRGFGGVLAFELHPDPSGETDDETLVARVVERLELAHRAASLGSVATLVGPPATTSHVEMSRDDRARAGIPETLIRYSCGIENPDDLIADLERALRVHPLTGAEPPG